MRRLPLVLLFTTTIITGFAQVGIGTTAPNPSSILDLTATNKAFIPPRMNTSQQNAISNPTMGMMIYNTDSSCLIIYRGSGWFNICNVIQPLYSGSVVAYAPVAVPKTKTQRVFAHLMPWFETPASNTQSPGSWGGHWTMNAQNPNTFNTSNQRNIGSHYYPLTGPYASNDTTIIDYQLLLMKLSGIDGVLIDWPGTSTSYDLPMNEANVQAFVARIAKAGLNFALVYEDYTLSYASNELTQAQADMAYAQTNYFSNANYEKVNGKPLLLDFGPQQLTGASNWTSAFSGLTTKPTFITLMNNSNAGTAAAGQFGWVEQSGTTALASFYNSNPGMIITDAFPGYNSYYALAGSGYNNGPTWVVAANGTSTFQSALTQALQVSSSNYLQLTTWNDYGEGTMIEPTDSTTGGFGYKLLTTLQTNLGVTNTLSQTDLAAVFELYNLRQKYVGNAAILNELDQAFYYMVSLQMSKAEAIMAPL